MTAVDRVEEYLIKNRFASTKKIKELGYKNPYNSISYLRARGHEIVRVCPGDKVGTCSFTEPGYYMVKAVKNAAAPETPGEKTAEKKVRKEKTIDGLIGSLKDKCDWCVKVGAGNGTAVRIMSWVIEELEEIKASA
jgi:hypothetical protein